MNKNPHRGSDFDDFLREEGWLEHATEIARRAVDAYQSLEAKRDIQAEMQKAADDYQEYKKKMQ